MRRPENFSESEWRSVLDAVTAADETEIMSSVGSSTTTTSSRRGGGRGGSRGRRGRRGGGGGGGGGGSNNYGHPSDYDYPDDYDPDSELVFFDEKRGGGAMGKKASSAALSVNDFEGVGVDWGRRPGKGKGGGKRRPIVKESDSMSIKECSALADQYPLELIMEADPTAFKARMSAARIRSASNAQLDATTSGAAREILGLLYGHFVLIYDRDLLRHSCLAGKKLRVCIPPDKHIFCSQECGVIHIGSSIISDMTAGDTSQYQLEREALEAHVKDKEGLLIWFGIHEFVHLFIRPHTKEFFASVCTYADSHPFLFGE
ncbi:hypothetical protein Pelo_13128 [Pelomyxa schiedti]|nr:hypothetical protein Pelo_13128 [Pelomyxa schiedti]